MELVKLKMKKSYKTFLALLAILIIGLMVVGVLYLFYDNVLDKSLIEVTGNLSINYLNGKTLETNKSKEMEFSITNGGDKPLYFVFNLSHIRGNGSYKIISNNQTILESDLGKDSELLTDNFSIDSKETRNYKMILTSKDGNTTSAILNVRTEENKIVTFGQIIIDNNKVLDVPLTKVGEAATENEGLIKDSDDIGITYYFRGNTPNNYVSFSDMLWRIVRINGDGTVRLVLNTETELVSNYYQEYSKDITYKKSNMNTFLKNWFQDNINNKEVVVSAKFCSDISKDEAGNFNAYTRVMVNKIPAFNCLGESINSEIGLLSIDEVILAGAPLDGENKDFYLHSDSVTHPFYTMSGAKGNDEGMNLFMVEPNGKLQTTLLGNLNRGVRPVINLVKNVSVKGSGTITDPYYIDNIEP